MRGSEEHFIFPRPEERAGRLSHSGRNAASVSRGEIQRVDLVERIVRFALALKDERLAIGREITFPAAPPLEDELPGVGEEPRLVFGLLRHRVPPNEAEADRKKKRSGEMEIHIVMIWRERLFTRVPATAQHAAINGRLLPKWIVATLPGLSASRNADGPASGWNAGQDGLRFQRRENPSQPSVSPVICSVSAPLWCPAVVNFDQPDASAAIHSRK